MGLLRRLKFSGDCGVSRLRYVTAKLDLVRSLAPTSQQPKSELEFVRISSPYEALMHR